MHKDEIKRLIETGMEAEEVIVQGDDGAHFEALVVADAFAGKRTLQRHKIVYGTLGERMGREIHALSLKTLTREELEQQQGDA
ncbi:MAG: BolA/IbaG family iron-sulfur metabolism protein [Pseudomonadota bacterium]